ncbi:bis(5'-adenosyl)-triphosphatase ENPP4 isoform X2 [Peromyscus maniculatus bairdii]|uniref:bis(5'-adenosyl)-triphosphatase ENPP4 isoform X2 n=2 Tax=Peromyscus maniculatus bairdii TaxID=230844 RepID=UPI001C2E9CCA|nr:bis(5'-adenosyl)-triphosphatase ENPP4 isoform X2 [Peromyscus maniculatus bairdii]
MLGQALHKQPVPCWSQPGALRAAQLVTGQFRCTFGALGAVFKVFVMKLLVILLFLGLLSGCRGNSSYSLTPQLLLVSFDGFRADYLQNYDFPHLQNFIKEGVLVEHVTNVFITKTFPNHYSIVTGLYEESHGIVANSMYDEVTKKHFSETNDKDPFWWDGAVPIWVTNQLQENRSSAAAMWPGTDVPIHNTTPSYFMNYSSSVPFEERLNNVTEWLSSSNPPVTFATLYWEEPDASGHRYGPEDKGNMSRVLKEIDGLVGDLVQRLKVLGLWENLNVIITSDHGMTQCSENRLIHLDSCLDHSNYTVIDLTPVAAILPKINVTEVYDKLKHCSPHMTVYLKEEIPDRFHYQHNDRIQPIILVADEGWTIVLNKSSLKCDHGYDNSLPTMHPFLAAHGPAFRRGYKQSTMNTVDIYPMMCHILGLKPHPNNGTFSHTKCLLVDQWCINLPEVIGIVVSALLLLTLLTGLMIFMQNRTPASRPFSRLQLQEDDDDPLIG